MKWWIACAILVGAGCASQSADMTADVASTGGDTPLEEITTVAGITLVEPIAVSVDFNGNLLVADGALGRLVRISATRDDALEFQQPTQNASFYPADAKLSGFFIYALDPVERVLLRFDRTGAYRDVLINFDRAFEGRRLQPVGLDVDGSGRIVISDSKNHQVILFDSYLQVELIFGSYGTFAGQFDSPEGVSFTTEGDVLVSDTGNRRLQLFDAGGSFERSIPSDPRTGPLRRPRRAVADGKGRIFVADPGAERVFVFDAMGGLLRQILPAGVREFRPMDVAVTASGTVYVADTANGVLYSFR